jgi:hypothetical protein
MIRISVDRRQGRVECEIKSCECCSGVSWLVIVTLFVCCHKYCSHGIDEVNFLGRRIKE